MTGVKKKAVSSLVHNEIGYPERIETGLEAIEVIENWYKCLLDMGYELRDSSTCPKLIRLSDGKEMTMIHSVENYRVSVLPILSCL